MSAEAIAYVATLLRCPDGAALNCTQKCILFCLADHHNRSSHRCDPSQELLVAESLTSKDTVQRAVDHLQRHGVLQVSRPILQGRGKRTSYTFPALDAAEEVREGGKYLPKGEHGAPLFSPPERGAKGEQIAPERGAKGEHPPVCNKEEPVTIEPKNQGHARASARPPVLSQAERDSLDLKRWQLAMNVTFASGSSRDRDPDTVWRARARHAAFIGGISPARLVALLLQHYPTDPNIPLLYPALNLNALHTERPIPK
jgi:hypothetical protein